jgi:hypothetical protein
MPPSLVGTVTELHRYPVKSMLGETLTRAEVTAHGVVGDRVYALLDDETGKVVSVKRPNRWGRMFELTATTRGADVMVNFPDGATFATDDPDLPQHLSDWFGRAVSFATSPPPDSGYEELWAGELKDGAPPYLGMETEMIEGEEFIDGGAFMRANQNFFDFAALHLVTTSSTDELAAHAPGSRFEPRRFRPNIVVDAVEAGFVETQWRGRTLAIGDVRLRVGIPVPRCVMTTLAQDDLPADRNVLRTITALNRIDLLGTGAAYPCVGVYADVEAGGELAVGDPVLLV